MITQLCAQSSLEHLNNVKKELNLNEDHVAYIINGCVQLLIRPKAENNIQIILESGAKLDLFCIYDSSSVNDFHIVVNNRASVNLTHVCIGSLVKNNVIVDLKGEHAQCRSVEVSYSASQDLFESSIMINHHAQSTHSVVDTRSIVDDFAVLIGHGNILVSKAAQCSVAKLTHHILLLSKDAHAETIPAMEVLSDDVVAAHAASTSRIAQDQLVYLGIKGINADDAKKMIALGFLQSILKSHEEQTRIMNLVEEKWSKLHCRK